MVEKLGFIDKALEKAKSLPPRKEPAVTAPQPEGRLEELPPAWEPAPASYPLPALGEKIDYTITRVVPVDFDFLRRQKIVAGDNHEAVAEEYKLIRTHILHRTKAENLNTIMITGPRPNEGKTLTAINLAISLAQEVNQTVLLVDADLRNPSIHRYLGLPDGPGLVDYLMAGVTIPDLLIHPEGLPKLVVLPGGRPVSEAAELISSPLMGELVKELKNFYPNRYVLFDLPPLLSFADALAFAPLVDALVLVVEMGRTPREDISNCLELLSKYNVLGSVLNKVAPDEHRHKYYYYRPPSQSFPKNIFSRWLK